MDISIVIPLFNEDQSIGELHQWIRKVMIENSLTYEILFIDDGSTDNSWQVISELSKEDSNVIGVKFQRNYGKSAALNVGFEIAEGEVVITMDADLQDSPEELPGLFKMISEEDYDLVSGWKKKRYDPIMKTLPSKFFNGTTRVLSGIKLHDFNCGLKAYRKNVVKSLEVYGEMHRYIPLIAKRAGFNKIGEKIVEHQKRKYGVTKFGFERFINGYLDLLSISFVTRFGQSPMHLFGTLGTLVFIIGFIMILYVGGVKAHSMWMEGERTRNIAEISWFYMALTAMVIGSQLFLAGFLGELISRNSPERNKYLIEKTTRTS